MQEHDLTSYMNLAAASVEPVTDQRHVLEQEGLGRVPDESCVRMPRQRKYLLSTLCHGPPLTIIQSSDTESGFEVWRQLCRHYSTDPEVSQQRTLGRMSEPLLPDAHSQDASARWVPELGKCEGDSQKILPDTCSVGRWSLTTGA